MFYKSVDLMSYFYEGQTPPVFKILVTPAIVVWWIIALLISFTLWLMGFWTCSDCKKTLPFYKKNIPYYAGGNREDGPNKYNCCSNCRRAI